MARAFLCVEIEKESRCLQMEVAYRPSHADATYDFKYGIRAVAGGGRSSARETIGRVAAGAVAKKLLSLLAPGIEACLVISSYRYLSPYTQQLFVHGSTRPSGGGGWGGWVDSSSSASSLTLL